MRKQHLRKIVKTGLGILLISFAQNAYSQTFCTDPEHEQHAGNSDGYRYELWNQNGQGNACMTLGEGALFSGEWSEIQNYLARRGHMYDTSQTHKEIGYFYTEYDCDYRPTTEAGNSYLSIYGWTIDPLIEYYIVEDWRNWIPSMAHGVTLKDTFVVDGSVYEIFESTRVQQPSIVGTTTFQQYFSIRKDTRNSGTISVSKHFEKWEELGMPMGKLYEVSMVVEGYQSKGSFEFKELDVIESKKPLSEFELNTGVRLELKENNLIILLNDTSNTSIELLDSASKVEYSKDILDTNNVTINNLKSGTYQLKLKINETVYTENVVIN